jgi:hypothetical protein
MSGNFGLGINLEPQQELTMYCAIRLYDGVKFPDEAAAKVRKEFLPVISEIPGFQEYYAVKTGDNTMASVSVFKDKPGADKSVQVATIFAQPAASDQRRDGRPYDQRDQEGRRLSGCRRAEFF